MFIQILILENAVVTNYYIPLGVDCYEVNRQLLQHRDP